MNIKNIKIQKFIIEGSLPSMNEIIDVNRSNRYMAAQFKKDWDNVVAWSCKGIEKLEKKADIEVTFFMQNRRKDKDNIHAGIKFILDGMKKAGKIDNDGWNEIGDLSYKFKVDKKRPRVEVKIMEKVD